MGLRQLALKAAREYLIDHPEEIYRTVRNAMGLRFGVPLAALRWLGRQAEASGKVQNLSIRARPPGIQVAADVDLMKTPVRATAVIFFERVALTEEELTFSIRLEDVALELNSDAATPVAMLIRSGALNLSRPGDLAAYLPQRPPVLVEAEGNRLTLDLMKDPKLGSDPRVRHAVGLLTSFVTVHNIETDPEHLDVVFRAFPKGLFTAAKAVKEHLVEPSLNRLLPVLRR